jgi:hypothetical protein
MKEFKQKSTFFLQKNSFIPKKVDYDRLYALSSRDARN